MLDTEDEMNIVRKLLMIFITLMILGKTFFFLRIFSGLIYIVIMLKHVFSDLKVFILFYSIVVLMSSVIFSILGIEKVDDYIVQRCNPGFEYAKISVFESNIFRVFRISLADFDFTGTKHLTSIETYIFWSTWSLIVLLTCIVFLNFIIAEVNESYQ